MNQQKNPAEVSVARQIAPVVGTGGNVTGLEISPAMFAVARALPKPDGVRTEWREGDATALPFAPGSFDLILCQQGLQSFPNRAKAVAGGHRTMRKQGDRK
jgi:ubiquinone/menaquinone biosynthesis C-methylase UbiE